MQGQYSLMLMEGTQGMITSESETMSPDVPVGSSPCLDEDDKDDEWMQYISDDAWCTNVSSNEVVKEPSCMDFAN